MSDVRRLGPLALAAALALPSCSEQEVKVIPAPAQPAGDGAASSKVPVSPGIPRSTGRGDR